MNSEIEITSLLGSEDFCPFDLSNNRATLGDSAGELPWAASLKSARTIAPPLLNSDELKEEFRDFVESSGGWTREEINAWSDEELNALLLQWIAGDIREAFGDAEPGTWDWASYEERATSGQISGRLFHVDDKTYFSISQ